MKVFSARAVISSQLLFSFDRGMKVEKNSLMQTLASQFSSTLMQLLFSFDRGMRVEKNLMQTLASQFSSTLMQLLFSFDRGMRTEKNLMQILNSHQLSCNSCSRLTGA
jgi:small-conductance mechanosensitive channel